jgi:hypothetical protein
MSTAAVRKYVPAIPASASRVDGPDAVARELDVSDQDEADALADAIEAGDCDADGEPVGYDMYRSAV